MYYVTTLSVILTDAGAPSVRANVADFGFRLSSRERVVRRSLQLPSGLALTNTLIMRVGEAVRNVLAKVSCRA